MNLEQNIKDVITKKLEDGTVEKLIAAELEKGIKNALENLFRSYGEVTKIIENKIKSIMIPYLESYDYSEYIVKLDDVLTEILKNSTTENKQLLHNFKNLMTIEEKDKTITVTELFEKWKEYVAKNVNTDGLEIDYDDKPTYESVDVRFEIEYNSDRDWSSFEYATLVFECDHDDEMNFALRLSRWKSDKDKGWDIRYDRKYDLSSLRYLNDFELLLIKLEQNRTKILIDDDYGDDYVEPEKEPELTYQ